MDSSSESGCGCMSTYTWLALIGGIIYAIHKFIQSRKTYWSKQNIIVAKNAFFARFRKPLHEAEKVLVQEYGKVFGVYELLRPVLWVSDPDVLRNILSKDFHMFTNRRNFQSGDKITSRMVSTIEDDDWKRVRSIMSPTFSSGKLRRMRPLIDDCIKTLVSNFGMLIDKESPKTFVEVDTKRVFGSFSMDIVIQVAFGTKVDSLIDEDNQIIKHARSLFNRNISPKLMFFFLFPTLARKSGISPFSPTVTGFFKDFTMKIIEERKKNPSKGKRYDFLQLMLDAMETEDFDAMNENENADEEEKNKAKDMNGMTPEDSADYVPIMTHNKSLDFDEFTAQCILFFLAGYDTTATTLSYVSYLLAMNPDAQEKLFQEVKNAMGDKDQIDYEKIPDLKYLDGVVSESLRMFPAAPFLERRASEDYTFEYDGKSVTIEKDMIVHIPSYAMHMSEEHFSEPDKFKPERFFPENKSHHAYSYLPFGAGPRNCLGMRLALLEAKLAIINVVNKYKFSTCDKTSMPPKTYVGGGLLSPVDVILRVEKRN